MNIESHPDVVTRKDFGPFLVARGLTGTAVEIGTHTGEYAADLLSVWPGRLICVDPWQNRLPHYHDALAHRNRDEDYEAAVERLRPYMDRVELWRMLSTEAVLKVADNSLDFVYVDGNHQRPFVEQDMEIWWPKLRVGGVHAGHDLNNWEWGINDIEPAVMAFAERHGVQPQKTVCCGIDSWFFIKPEGKSHEVETI